MSDHFILPSADDIAAVKNGSLSDNGYRPDPAVIDEPIADTQIEDPFARTREHLEQISRHQDGKDFLQDVNTPIPEGLPDPGTWRVTLMPVYQRVKTKGKLWVPEEVLDTDNWTHMLWKVCKLGPLVYRGPAWRAFTDEQLEACMPKVGEIYLADPKAPRRYRYHGVVYIVVGDDQLWSKVDPEYISGLQFSGAEL